MAKDKFKATWVSHSSINDYLECPRAYFLKNVYKDPETNNKITIANPALSLGWAVHEVLDQISKLPTTERFKISLIDRLKDIWQEVAGKKGGFFDEQSEYQYRKRGEEMLKKVYQNPGPLDKPAVKIKGDLPYYWLSDEEEIILCGKVDWLEYLEKQDAVHIIDFKTGKHRESPESLQLPIYYLLVTKTQSKEVAKASYWYLDSSETLEEQHLPNLEESEKKILNIARKIKIARNLKTFDCPHGGCRSCSSFERIINGEGEKVGNNQYGADVYILPHKKEENKEFEIL